MVKGKLPFDAYSVILLIIIVLIAVFVIKALLEEAYVNSSTDLNTKPLTASPTSVIRKRTSYDFEKILGKEFLVFENKEFGFKIKYPLEIELYKYGVQETQSRIMYVADEQPIGGIELSLLSQPKDVETEVYDGMLIKIAYYENLKNRTLEEIIQEQTKNYDIKTGFGTRMKGVLTINGNKGAKLIDCCFGGETEMYYFLTKGGKYFIQLVVFTVGEDERQFEMVAEKIIYSLSF